MTDKLQIEDNSSVLEFEKAEVANTDDKLENNVTSPNHTTQESVDVLPKTTAEEKSQTSPNKSTNMSTSEEAATEIADIPESTITESGKAELAESEEGATEAAECLDQSPKDGSQQTAPQKVFSHQIKSSLNGKN